MNSNNHDFSARHFIREKTQPYHNAAEQSFEPIFNAQSKVSYAKHLSHYANFYIALENSIFEKQNFLPDFDLMPLKRSHLIQQDISALNGPLSDKTVLKFHLPQISSKADLLGALYVIEGSKLGGQIITKSLSTTLGLSETNGCAFFFAHGPNTGLMWKSFLTVLEKELDTQKLAEEATLAASETFKKLTNWMTSQDDLPNSPVA